MKTIIALLFLLPVGVFAYVPSVSDQQILGNVETKIARESTARLEVISGKIEKVLPNFFTQDQIYYILNQLILIIDNEISRRTVFVQEAAVVSLPSITSPVIEKEQNLSITQQPVVQPVIEEEIEEPVVLPPVRLTKQEEMDLRIQKAIEEKEERDRISEESRIAEEERVRIEEENAVYTFVNGGVTYSDQGQPIFGEDYVLRNGECYENIEYCEKKIAGLPTYDKPLKMNTEKSHMYTTDIYE